MTPLTYLGCTNASQLCSLGYNYTLLVCSESAKKSIPTWNCSPIKLAVLSNCRIISGDIVLFFLLLELYAAWVPSSSIIFNKGGTCLQLIFSKLNNLHQSNPDGQRELHEPSLWALFYAITWLLHSYRLRLSRIYCYVDGNLAFKGRSSDQKVPCLISDPAVNMTLNHKLLRALHHQCISMCLNGWM